MIPYNIQKIKAQSAKYIFDTVKCKAAISKTNAAESCFPAASVDTHIFTFIY